MQHQQQRVRLKILAHTLSMDIFMFVNRNKDVPVNAVYKHFKMEQSICSTLLNRLRRSGLLLSTRKGRNVLYRVDKREFRVFCNSMRKAVCGT